MIGRKANGLEAHRNARLQARLREGDPAGDGRSLPPERVREMRRQVLGSLAEPRRPRRFLALASVASAVSAALVLALALALHREVPAPAPQPEPAATTATTATTETAASRPPVPPQTLSPSTPAPARGSESAVPAERLSPTPRRSAPRVAARPPAQRKTASTPAATSTIPPEKETGPLQIQFSTPGGTRIIWVLDPAESP